MSGLLGDLAGAATGGLWKYATIGLGAISLIGGAWIGLDDYMTHRERDKYAKQLTAAIEQRGRDSASIAALRASIDVQNVQIDAASKLSQAKLAAASDIVDVYRGQNDGLQRQVSQILTRPLVSKTVCTRMDEADLRVMGDLK